MRFRTVLAIAVPLVVLVVLAGWLLVPDLSPLRQGGVEQTLPDADLRVTMRIDRDTLGTRVIDVLVRDAQGRPTAVESVKLDFTMREMDMGQIEAEAQRQADGHFQARGPFFTMAGEWQIRATIARPGQSPHQPLFIFPIGAEGEQAGPTNPLVPDPNTINAGRLLYQSNCVPCHGPNGRGDGSAALGLQPRPANFTEHMVPGLHTDGQIFLWIKNGYPGTSMPAWGNRLSDDQIWQLVLFLRTFAPLPVAGSGTSQAIPTLPIPDQPVRPTDTLPTPTPAVPTSDEPLPPLVFVRGGNLWRSSGDGSALRQLTRFDQESYTEHPAVAPDGSRIAYIHVTPPPLTATLPLPLSGVFVIDANGSNPRPIWQPGQGQVSQPSWSPDGQALYVAANSVEPTISNTGGLGQLQVVRIDLATGARQTVLTAAMDPALAPDGSVLAFIRLSLERPAMSLALAAPDGSDVRTLIDGTDFEGFYAPRFSPDGQRVVVAAIGGPATDERGLPLPPRSLSPLERLLGLLEPPAASAHGLPWDLWEVKLDGSGLRRLTNLAEDLPMAAFDPDGSRIAVMGANGIYMMNSDGSNQRRLQGEGDHGGLTWGK